MNEKLRKFLMVCFGLVFICSFGMFLYQTIESKKGVNIYSEAEKLAYSSNYTQSDTESENRKTEEFEEWKEAPVENDSYISILEQINLFALQSVNSDLIGWISIPETKLSYPLVQGEDNDYYLHRTWNGESSIVGSVFVDYLNSPDLSDFHTIIYAHHMMDGTMFGSLREYKHQSYWEKHKYIYIYDDRGVHRYEIFSVYEANVESDTYRILFKTDQEKQEFLDECMNQSVIRTDVVPTFQDRIITLSTCTNTGSYATRWVVQARLKGV